MGLCLFMIDSLNHFVTIFPNQLLTVLVFNVASWLLFSCSFFCFQDIKNHKNVCQTFLQLCEIEADAKSTPCLFSGLHFLGSIM